MTKNLSLFVCLLPILCGCSTDAVAHDEPARVTFEAEPDLQQQGGSGSDWSGRGSYTVPLDASLAEAELHGRLTVPPERALSRMRAQVSAPDRRTVVQRVVEVTEQLRAGIGGQDGCEARIIELSTAQPVSEELWRATGVLSVNIDLRDLGGVSERHARLEQCLGAIGASVERLEGVEVRVGSPLLTVDDLDAHRGELLERALRPIERVSEIARTRNLAAQFDPMATRCRSTGQVSVLSRSLDGIALAIDLSCEPITPTLPPTPTQGDV